MYARKNLNKFQVDDRRARKRRKGGRGVRNRERKGNREVMTRIAEKLENGKIYEVMSFCPDNFRGQVASERKEKRLSGFNVRQ